jgi:hypothetical protein
MLSRSDMSGGELTDGGGSCQTRHRQLARVGPPRHFDVPRQVDQGVLVLTIARPKIHKACGTGERDSRRGRRLRAWAVGTRCDYAMRAPSLISPRFLVSGASGAIRARLRSPGFSRPRRNQGDHTRASEPLFDYPLREGFSRPTDDALVPIVAVGEEFPRIRANGLLPGRLPCPPASYTVISPQISAGCRLIHGRALA